MQTHKVQQQVSRKARLGDILSLLVVSLGAWVWGADDVSVVRCAKELGVKNGAHLSTQLSAVYS